MRGTDCILAMEKGVWSVEGFISSRWRFHRPLCTYIMKQAQLEFSSVIGWKRCIGRCPVAYLLYPPFMCTVHDRGAPRLYVDALDLMPNAVAAAWLAFIALSPSHQLSARIMPAGTCSYLDPALLASNAALGTLVSSQTFWFFACVGGSEFTLRWYNLGMFSSNRWASSTPVVVDLKRPKAPACLAVKNTRKR